MKTDAELAIESKLVDQLFKNTHFISDYRNARNESADFNYFDFTEIPTILSQHLHLEILRASQSVNACLFFTAQLVIQDRVFLDSKNLWKVLEIPAHVKYWLQTLEGDSLPPFVFWGRPDFVIHQGVPKYLEPNLSSSAGYQMQASALVDYYRENPFYRTDLSTALTEDPLECLSQSLGRRSKKGEVILFADIVESSRYGYQNAQPYSGMTALLREKTGLRVVGEFLENLTFSGEKIFIQENRIHQVFLSYYNPHVFEFDGRFSALWSAISKGGLNQLDSLAEILYSSKILLAFLSEFIQDLPLPLRLKKDFTHYVPWSRILRDCTTDYEGQKWNLYSLLKEKPENFVLKKAQSAESKGVFLGQTCETQKWHSLLEQACTEGGWVVQEYCLPDEEVSYSIQDGDIIEQDIQSTISPYFSEGVFAGYLKRYNTVASQKTTGQDAFSILMTPKLNTAFIV